MSLVTGQQISRYYDQYSQTDVTFTRDVIRTTLLYPKQIYLKCLGYQWPCILYSSSMQGAKIITNVRNSFKQIVAKANNMVSLRYSFIQRDKPDPISFFVNARVMEYSPYDADKPELSFLTLNFTNRPSDELILKLGVLLDAHSASMNRKEERIPLNPEVIKTLKISAKDTQVMIDHIPRKCILRDLSFSGARVIIMGVPKFILNKPAVLKLAFNDPNEKVDLQGKVIRFEAIEGRQDVGAFVIQFTEEEIPVEYKLRLSSYFKTSGKRKISSDDV